MENESNNANNFLKRGDKENSVTIITDNVLKTVRNYLKKEGFTEILPPTITLIAAEDPSTLFGFQYYNHGAAYLSQTAQPYLESNIPALKKVYSISPTYRNEDIVSRKHLSEFWALEVEQGFCDMENSMNFLENLFSHVILTVIDQNCKELQLLKRNISALENHVKLPIKRLTYNQAIEYHNERLRHIKREIKIEETTTTPEHLELINLVKQGKITEIKWGEKFSSEQEDILCDGLGIPFFVTDFPVKARPFYMKPNSDNPNITLSYDMFAPFAGELVTGGERINDYKLLLQRIDERNLPRWAYDWYVDLRKYDHVQEVGFEMGIERLLMVITGFLDIRDVTQYPRVSDRRPYP